MAVHHHPAGRILLAACLALSPLSLAQEKPQKPLDLDVETDVEVRLVTIDAVVLDHDDRTVPDLTKEDFLLKIDRKTVPIDTFDVACPIGAADDEEGLRWKQKEGKPAVAGGAAPQIVLAVDYYHLDSVSDRASAVENIHRSMTARMTGDEKLMLVAIADGLQIKQPFTGDHERFRASLRRMAGDVALWNGTFLHETEQPLFDALEKLMQALSKVPGPKALVFFSDGNWPPESGPGFEYDLAFKSLAAAASHARVTIYPVLASGLKESASAITPPGG